MMHTYCDRKLVEVAVRGIPRRFHRALVAIVRTVLSHESPSAWEVSVADVSLKKMKELNLAYRQKAQPTDILSFVLEKPRRGAKGYAEILICSSFIARRVRDRGIWMSPYLKRLFIHACLHIAGYNHQATHDRRLMETMEQTYLLRVGDAKSKSQNPK